MNSPNELNLLVTLWPSCDHFDRFASDRRIQAMRLNPAMIDPERLEKELSLMKGRNITTPLFFDVKGRQLRVETVQPSRSRMKLTLNHAIKVDTPTTVLFKAGNDRALLETLEDDGKTLVFASGADHGPSYAVKSGESLHIRDPSLTVIDDPLFTDIEKEKIEIAKSHGFKRWFLSYVEKKTDAEQLRELVGEDAEVWLKIESEKGLRFVKEDFVKDDNTRLVAACGDLYVEMEKPHQILPALLDILKADPDACAASRMMLSITQNVRRFGLTTPDLADFAHLAWLQLVGYRTFMLCDEICLADDLLGPAVGAFNAWRKQALEV